MKPGTGPGQSLAGPWLAAPAAAMLVLVACALPADLAWSSDH